MAKASGSRVRRLVTRDGTPVSELAGEVWAVPVPRMGYCPLVIARAPREQAEVDFAFAYVHLTLSEQPPAVESIPPLDAWTKAWIGLVPTLPFRNGRWKRLGTLPGFDRSLWPVPPARASVVDESKPVEEWGKHPWGEMWSIETTTDEPTMTLIANTPATREQALRFPAIDTMTAASSIEKGLVTYFKGKEPLFWDVDLCISDVSPESPRIWREYAERVRSAPPLTPPSWLPAGRRTDRQLKAGAWMGMPLQGGGFGAALLIAKPAPHERFFSDAVVFAMRRRWDRWPSFEEVSALTPDDGALVTQTSMICVRDGRWRVLGYQEELEPTEWVWPRPWSRLPEHKKAGVVSIRTGSETEIEVPVDPAILRLDPRAGKRGAVYSPYGSIELDVPRIMDGTCPDAKDSSTFPSGIVTPERLAAWRKINDALRKAIAAHSS